MSQRSPRPDPAAEAVRWSPGVREGCLWVEPAYRRRGLEQALPEVWLRAGVAERLLEVAAALREDGVALLVWDGWRPLDLQRRLWCQYRDELAATTGLAGAALDSKTREFVAPVGGDEEPAHSTGAAVDLSLCTPEGNPLDMGGEFDELTERSHPGYYERDVLSATETIYRDRRRLLDRAMRERGFCRLPSEWWHFEYGTATWARRNGKMIIFGPLPAAA
jgi:D-alanyl-D-alanine dipeptidase